MLMHIVHIYFPGKGEPNLHNKVKIDRGVKIPSHQKKVREETKTMMLFLYVYGRRKGISNKEVP